MNPPIKSEKWGIAGGLSKKNGSLKNGWRIQLQRTFLFHPDHPNRSSGDSIAFIERTYLTKDPEYANFSDRSQYLHLETVVGQEIREVLKRKDIDPVLCSQNRSTMTDDDPPAQSLKLCHGA